LKQDVYTISGESGKESGPWMPQLCEEGIHMPIGKLNQIFFVNYNEIIIIVVTIKFFTKCYFQNSV